MRHHHAAYLGLLVIGMTLLASPRPASAQFISPGKLTSAHASEEGARNCTSCHELRKRGTQNGLCLACHAPLAELIDEGRGLHATLEGSCARCHKEHGGRDLDMVRFDSLGFDHADAGYEFEGAHADAGCRDCHAPNLIADADTRLFKARNGVLRSTFLGLGTRCVACHRRDDPHGGQFKQAECTDCHGQVEWSPAPGFDHDRTRYPLRGLHRQVGCAECHPSDRSKSPEVVRYRPLRFARCTNCHEDEHRGRMGATCTSCHGTAGWGIDAGAFEDAFDHTSVDYVLNGAHASVGCAGCHDPAASRREGIDLSFRQADLGKAYPAPAADDCTACHVDYHEGAFAASPTGGACAGCHSESAWHPSSYDLFRHNDEADFELEGAHLAAPCESCHANADPTGGLRLEISDQSCAGCHAEDDPHRDQFAPGICEDCHGTESFRIPGFDHDLTAYPLDGAHRGVACSSCHVAEEQADGRRFVRYKPIDTSCRSCHGGTE
ncbi:MAG: hypothetical protein ABFS34_02685 [Gemmatimonadota bacterium]